MADATNPAEDLRAEEAELARRKHEHDAPLLARAAAILAQIAPAAAELDLLGRQVLAPFIGPNLGALAADVARCIPMLDIAQAEGRRAMAKSLTQAPALDVNLKVGG